MACVRVRVCVCARVRVRVYRGFSSAFDFQLHSPTCSAMLTGCDRAPEKSLPHWGRRSEPRKGIFEKPAEFSGARKTNETVNIILDGLSAKKEVDTFNKQTENRSPLQQSTGNAASFTLGIAAGEPNYELDQVRFRRAVSSPHTRDVSC